MVYSRQRLDLGAKLFLEPVAIFTFQCLFPQDFDHHLRAARQFEISRQEDLADAALPKFALDKVAPVQNRARREHEVLSAVDQSIGAVRPLVGRYSIHGQRFSRRLLLRELSGGLLIGSIHFYVLLRRCPTSFQLVDGFPSRPLPEASTSWKLVGHCV